MKKNDLIASNMQGSISFSLRLKRDWNQHIGLKKHYPSSREIVRIYVLSEAFACLEIAHPISSGDLALI